MKRTAALFLWMVILLTVPVFADVGPKTQLIVRVENGPEELYYLDILAEGESSPYSDQTVGGLMDSYTEEELAALDQNLLEDFTASVPKGWYACTVQGRMVWGNIDSEDGFHSFGYLGVPKICRVLMVTKSGETFLSEPFTRQVIQCSVTVDWAGKTLKMPPLWMGYALQFLATFLPTLAVEGILLLLFRLWSRRNAWMFLLVNLVTQGGLTLWMSLETVHHGAMGISVYPDLFWHFLSNIQYVIESFWYEVEWISPYLLLAEAVIFLVEMGLYASLFQNCSKKKAVLYALTANLCSFALGLFLAKPVWKFAVRTIL